jgi:RNA recognition motif-containing protein
MISTVFLPVNVLTLECSFAFVEYESRRDADDAYHEMHNKRIGRDDLLKIEVSRILAVALASFFFSFFFFF